MDHIWEHGYKWRTYRYLWSAECRGLVRRQHRTEHGTVRRSYMQWNNSQPEKNPQKKRESNKESLDQKVTRLSVSHELIVCEATWDMPRYFFSNIYKNNFKFQFETHEKSGQEELQQTYLPSHKLFIVVLVSSFLVCIPWSHGLRPKSFKLMRRCHQLLSGFLANDYLPRLSDNEMIPGAVHRSPGIYLIV